MGRVALRNIVFGLTATGLLIGCVESGGKSGAGATDAPVQSRAKGGSQDVEAPEVFQATDSALWDGRPSLGGIWVASPDVTTPERALIFNPATGKSVTGALFKRERENPGPRLQLSSDAAEALGILAGQPTEIRVTALRKVEVEELAAPEATAEATAEAAPAAGADAGAAAIASAALDAVEGKPDPAAGETAPADGSGEALAATAAAAGTAAALAPEAAPKKKTWKERRAEAKAAREAKRRAAAEAKAAAAAAAAGTTVAEGEAPTASPDVAAAALAPIETAPLDARDPAAVAAAKPEKPKRKTVGDAPAPAAAAPAAETSAASGPARPIQVASYSKEDNARRAAEALAKIGVTATPQKSETNGKAVWGVVVMGDEAMLKKIKDAGFADAYFLK